MTDNRNLIYTRQFALLAFATCLTFRVSRLPPLMRQAVGTNDLFVLLLYLLLDAAQFFVVYKFVATGGKEAIQDTVFYKVAGAMLFVNFFMKTFMATAGTTAFTTESLFEDIGTGSVVVALLVTTGYIAAKGIRTIGRTAEISSFLIFTVFTLNLVFLKVYLDISENLPFIDGEVLDVLKRGDKFFMWFGDATPLLFLSIKPSKRNPTSLMYGLSAGFVIIGFVLMNAIYGNASEYVVNLVVKVAGFNQFSDVLGRLDWTGIIVWLMLAVIYISTYLWASGEALKNLFKGKKNIVIVLTAGKSYFSLCHRESGQGIHHKQYILALIPEILCDCRCCFGSLVSLQSRFIRSCYNDYRTLHTFFTKVTFDEFTDFSSTLSYQCDYIDISLGVSCKHTHQRRLTYTGTGKDTDSLSFTYCDQTIYSLHSKRQDFIYNLSAHRIRRRCFQRISLY